ncbi:PAS domain S-box protein [Caulobacter segnis]
MSEHDRLAALVSYRVLDTAPEPVFDDITRLAAQLFDTPMATVSLIDRERQWFKSRHGLDGCSTPRDQAFCDHAIRLPPHEIMVVENATQDPRFADNPLVTGDPKVRFYAGAVLTTAEGYNLGTLCVIDDKPRPAITDAQKAQLRVLASAVVAQLEKTRYERRLQEESRLLQMTETISGVGHWRANLLTGAIHWSDEVYKIYGLTPETFTPSSDNWLNLYHPDDRVAARAAFGRVVKGEPLVEHQLRLMRADGEVRQGLGRATCEYDETGKVVAVFGVLEDVTARNAAFEALRRSENQLRASEAHARKVVANAYQAIVTIDEAGQVTGWNRFAEQTFGWTAEEAIGKRLSDFIIPEEHRNAHNRGMARFLRTGESAVIDQRIEVPAQRKSGETFPIELAISGAEGPDGWAFTALMHDISARKAQMEIFETSFDHAAVGMALVTLEGGFHKINDAFCGIVGYSPEELLATDFQTITHPDDLEKDLSLLQQLLAGEISTYGMDKRYLHKDGRLVWVHLSVSLVRAPDGAPKHFIAQVQDQTARIEAQDALERQTLSLAAMAEQLAVAKDVAEDAARAKAEFLATMSHELRTPLNSVIGFARLLTDSRELTSADRRNAERVRSAGESLNVLINDILDYSKLDAGAVALEAKPFSLDDLVSDTLAMVEPQASERGVSLRRAGRTAGWVEGDAFRLRQVLLNLLSNAVKFTKDAAVSVEVTPLDATAGRRRLRVCVIDEGVGIAPDALGRLFTRYSQADDSISRKFGGTGLGLAISRELVELMGGVIGVESTLDEGSTFWFEIDFAIAAPIVSVGAPKALRRFEGRRVLLVDDTELNRELFKALLERRGCMVGLAADGAEAVAALETARYDLVLMDVHMPVMDGRAATREIRRRGLTDAPILALTAGGTPDQIAACKAAGMTDYLLKPLSEQQLEQALAQHLLGDDAPAPSPADELEDERQARDALEALMGAEASLKMARLLRGQLGAVLRDPASRTLSEEAHTTAGSAGLLGFMRLSGAARALEDCLRAGEPSTNAFAAARTAADAAERVLATWIARLEGVLPHEVAA